MPTRGVPASWVGAGRAGAGGAPGAGAGGAVVVVVDEVEVDEVDEEELVLDDAGVVVVVDSGPLVVVVAGSVVVVVDVLDVVVVGGAVIVNGVSFRVLLGQAGPEKFGLQPVTGCAPTFASFGTSKKLPEKWPLPSVVSVPREVESK
jgi:hypothetical protein